MRRDTWIFIGLFLSWGILTLIQYDNAQPSMVIQFSSTTSALWILVTLSVAILLLSRVPRRAVTQPRSLETIAPYLSDSVVLYDKKGRIQWQNENSKQFFPSSDELAKALTVFQERQPDTNQVQMQVVSLDEQSRFTAYTIPLNNTESMLVMRPIKNQSNHVYDNFIRRIVHDMRNPLAGIIGHAANLQYSAGEDQEDFKTSAMTIEHEAQRLARLVDSMLFDARLAYIPLNIECLNLLDVVEEAFFAYEERAANANKQIVINAPQQQLRTEGDRDLLLRAFENLIDNSLKYTDDAAIIEIRLSLHKQTCQLCFKDNGHGIPPSYLPDKIFEPMVRGQSAVAGSGLGLSIVKKIIEMHHGVIRAESKVDIGTEMYITLPRGGTLCHE